MKRMVMVLTVGALFLALTAGVALHGSDAVQFADDDSERGASSRSESVLQ